MKHNIAEIGATMLFQEHSLTIVKARKGCKGCFFESEKGAKDCPHTNFCFAHERSDRESVIFSKITNE